MHRPRILEAAWAGVALGVFGFALVALPDLLACVGEAQPSRAGVASASGPSGDARILFKAANQERALRGLRPLAWDDSLALAALRHAEQMAEHKTLEHQLPGEAPLQQRANEAGARFSRVAENIAAGQDVEEIQSSWMHSPGHRANILDPEMTAAGIAVVSEGNRIYAVEDFARQVPNLTLDEQERRVSALIGVHGLRISDNQREARRACESGANPSLGASMTIVRFETSDLSTLPESVENAIKHYHYTAAAVGACRASAGDAFARYKIAVLLF